MASLNPEHDDEEPPTHQIGTLLSSPPDYTTIATFPAGSFLENLAVRHDGTILVSDMLSGSIWYVDPRKFGATQETVELIHKFEVEDLDQVNKGLGAVVDTDEGGSHGSYASTPAAEAIIAAPVHPREISDIFYVTSGIHGRKGTWWIYELDMRSFIPKSRTPIEKTAKNVEKVTSSEADTSFGRARMTRLASIPDATWLNGGTAIFSPKDGSLVLMAESYQGRIYSFNPSTRDVEVWLEHHLLKKMTTRPPWPGVNGLQFKGGPRAWVYFTNSDRGILGRVGVVDNDDDKHGYGVRPSRIETVATGCCGDDLCIDVHGNIYVATNPMNTVLKFPKIGTFVDTEKLQHAIPGGIPPYGETRRHDHRYKVKSGGIVCEPEREVVLGLKHGSGLSLPIIDPETTGPTAVSLADPWEGRGDLYVVTNGGIINPLDDVVREAKVLRVDLTAWKQWKLDVYGPKTVEDSEIDYEPSETSEEIQARIDAEEPIFDWGIGQDGDRDCGSSPQFRGNWD